MRPVFLLVFTVVLASAESLESSCDLSPAAAKAVASLPLLTNFSLSWEERIAPRRALAEKEPRDWALQFTLQEPIRHRFLSREWDRAIAIYRRLPDRALGELLEARLIGPLHRKQSREMIDRALTAAPNSPWPHLVAAEWAAIPVGRDPEFGAKHFEEFRRQCPENDRAFYLLDIVQDANRLATHLQDLRRRIELKKKGWLAEADVPLFRAAWPWEKAAAGAAGEAEFRQRVQSDLAAIRSMRAYASADWYSVLHFAYEQMLKDPAALEALNSDILKQAPDTLAAWHIEEQRLKRQNPAAALNPDMPALYARLARFRHQPFAAYAVTPVLFFSRSAELAPSDVERLSDIVLTNSEGHPDQSVSWPPVQLMVAEVYATRKVRLDRVPALVQRGLGEVELQEKYRRDSDALPKSARKVDHIPLTQTRARAVLIRHAVATDQKERAAAMLSDFRRMLEQTKPENNAAAQSSTWAQGHMMYLELLKVAGMELNPAAELRPPRPDEAERLPVEDFEATDLSGKRWRLADLKGKVAYVNVWTTWCAPCRAEMPGLQQLYERWKDRKDRVVLTISADAQEALAREFLRQGKYTFPVVHGSDIAEKFYPPVMFPQNWLIDPDGKRLSMNAPPPGESTFARIEELAAKLAKAQP